MNSRIVLEYPENNSTVELFNAAVREFWENYEEGCAVKYAFKGDNYAPDGLMLRWKAEAGAPFKVTVWQADSEYKVVCSAEDCFAAIRGLKDGDEYFWTVERDGDGGEKSPVFSFKARVPYGVVFVEGVSNTRDIGGFSGMDGRRISRGMVYRGAFLDGITDNGKSFARQALGIRTDLDLRNEGEGTADDAFSPIGEGVSHVLESGCMYTGNNWSGCAHVGKEGVDIEEGQNKLVRGLSVFANKESFPVYVHCVLGRDRTGTLIAVLLAMCGVSKRDIMLDYELSFFSTLGCGDGTDVGKIISYVKKVFDYIETFSGSTLQEKTLNFLKGAGMSDEQIEAIQRNMLTEVA